MNNLIEEHWIAPKLPKTEEQFQAMMYSLDEFLSKQDISPFAKLFHAKIEICKAYKISTFLFMPKYMEYLITNNIPFSGIDLLKRCEQWYENNLGDKAKNYLLLGEYAFLLRNQLWKVRVPIIFGKVRLYADHDLTINNNILNNFEQLTQTYANSLTNTELHNIMEHYILAHDALSVMNYLREINFDSKIYFNQAYSDYSLSVEALISNKITYGKSRRDTATCCEKIMKGILNEKNINFKLTHDLSNLAKSLNTELGTNIDINLIDKINTKADVSYDKEVSKFEAYDSHQNLLLFLKDLGNDLDLIKKLVKK